MFPHVLQVGQGIFPLEGLAHLIRCMGGREGGREGRESLIGQNFGSCTVEETTQIRWREASKGIQTQRKEEREARTLSRPIGRARAGTLP